MHHWLFDFIAWSSSQISTLRYAERVSQASQAIASVQSHTKCALCLAWQFILLMPFMFTLAAETILNTAEIEKVGVPIPLPV